jgi:hypothetical protein
MYSKETQSLNDHIVIKLILKPNFTNINREEHHLVQLEAFIDLVVPVLNLKIKDILNTLFP